MLEAYLRRNWSRFIGSEEPGVLRISTISSCRYDYGNDLALLFADGGSTPRYVMKIARKPRFGFKLEREYDALCQLAGVDRVGGYLPDACYLGEFEGRVFFIQEGIPGISLSRLLLDSGVGRGNRRLLFEAVDLLVRINRAGVGEGEPAALPASGPLGLESGQEGKLVASTRALSGLEGGFFLQGDYWPHNMLISGGRLKGVVDWEFAVPNAPLPMDIVWLLINAGYLLMLREQPRVPIEEAYRLSFYTAGRVGDLLKECCARYFEAMGIDRRLFPPLLETTLCAMAQRELEAYGAHGKVDAACREMLRYTLDHEEELLVH